MLADNHKLCYSIGMKGRHSAVLAIIVAVLTGLTYALVSFTNKPVVLEPQGMIGVEQRDLLFFATSIMMLVALPVFIMTAIIAHRYRATNKKARYTPNEDRGRMLELAWWGIPIAIVTILSVVAWQTSHSLDPFRPIASSQASYRVQVVALQWKWLFIYPDYKTASIGELAIPVGRPVEFSIASDAPMNSFWIPELGGQIYAMSGMNTQLHLVADRVGTFRGVSSNLSGEGFADMKFDVRALPDDDLARWHYDAATTSYHLTMTEYDSLVMPSVMSETRRYRLDDDQLYQRAIDKYALSHSTNKETPMDHGGMH